MNQKLLFKTTKRVREPPRQIEAINYDYIAAPPPK
jgi:hypothetical protein